jgi:hypothetical protein
MTTSVLQKFVTVAVAMSDSVADYLDSRSCAHRPSEGKPWIKLKNLNHDFRSLAEVTQIGLLRFHYDGIRLLPDSIPLGEHAGLVLEEFRVPFFSLEFNCNEFKLEILAETRRCGSTFIR